MKCVDKTQVASITIGLTTYNRPEFLRDAVLSILSQTYGNFELIIGNDYTKTPVTCRSLGINSDPRIKILNYSTNIGEIDNMNNLLNLSKTEWFVWMADDDAFHKFFLESALCSVSGDNSAVAAYSGYSDGDSLNEVFFNNIDVKPPISLPSNVFIDKYLSKELELIGCYGLMKTETLKSVGGMPSLGLSFSPYGDTLLPILLASHGTIKYIDSPMCFLRTHKDSLSISSSDFKAYTSAEIDFLNAFQKKIKNIKGGICMSLCIFKIVSWFRNDELSVISRDDSISKFSIAIKFIYYQVNINYPRLSIKYWTRFSIDNIVILLKFMIKPITRRKF